MTSTQGAFDAIVLAGGRARRLAGADKPATRIGGRRLLDIAVEAVSGAERIVVVGPDRPVPTGVLLTREDPPYGGPVAAIAAGITTLAATDRAGPAHARPVVVLASDLPALAARHIEELHGELGRLAVPAVFALDGGERPQYLLGVWRRTALQAALDASPDAAMRSLIPANAAFVSMTGIHDVDTPEQLDAARRADLGHSVDPVTARARITAWLTPLPPVTRPATSAAGAVLAEPLIATSPFPPFDAAAMDGYAVAGPSPWRITGAARAAGHADTPPLRHGEAAPIATGAVLPDGADRVLRHEETTLDGPLLMETSTGRDDTRRVGSAWQAGTALASAGVCVDAAVRSVARAAGVPAVTVRGPLRAHLHTSGDEVVPGDAAIPAGAIPDTASDPVAELLDVSGVHVTRAGHLPDRPDAFVTALSATGPDLIVIIGATGHGVADHLRAALTAAGAAVLVDGVALRPGGSLLLARTPASQERPGGTVILGLGGNPLAAVAGTATVLPAVLDGLLGRSPRPAETLALTVEAAQVGPRPVRHWRVVPVEPDGTGRWTIATDRGTGHLASVIGHRGLALVPPTGSDAVVERLR